MRNLRLPTVLIVLTMTLNCLNATPANRGHLEKRRCNTATCVTQRLADFLVRSSNSIGTVYTPTNVGSNTYGKRAGLAPLSRETLKYIQF
ncbi:IAPP protein, partial [Polyodon spathula]|nr:IAPP protein [Polyodon spathula]